MMQNERKSCYQIGSSTDAQGNIIARDFVFQPNIVPPQTFTLTVTSPENLQRISAQNQTQPEELKIDSNLLVFHDFPNLDIDQICQRLHDMPFDQLSPYLTPQQQEENI